MRVERIELSSTAWKAVILPLNYTRLYRPRTPASKMVFLSKPHDNRVHSTKKQKPAQPRGLLF